MSFFLVGLPVYEVVDFINRVDLLVVFTETIFKVGPVAFLPRFELVLRVGNRFY